MNSSHNTLYIILIILSLVLGITVVTSTAGIVGIRLGERAARSSVSQAQAATSLEPTIQEAGENTEPETKSPTPQNSVSSLSDGTVRLPLYAILLAATLYLVLFVTCIVLAVQLSAAKRQNSEESISIPSAPYPSTPARAERPEEDPFAAYEEVFDD